MTEHVQKAEHVTDRNMLWFSSCSLVFFQKTNKAGKIRYQLMVKCLLKRDEMLVTLLDSDQQLLSVIQTNLVSLMHREFAPTVGNFEQYMHKKTLSWSWFSSKLWLGYKGYLVRMKIRYFEQESHSRCPHSCFRR